MNQKLGNQTVRFGFSPYIISRASVVGTKEGEGPLKDTFDMIVSDDKMGQISWDLAEGAFQKTAVEIALKKAELENKDIEYILSGDLQNQCAHKKIGDPVYAKADQCPQQTPGKISEGTQQIFPKKLAEDQKRQSEKRHEYSEIDLIRGQ